MCGTDLRPVDEHGGAGRVAALDQLGDRVDRAEHVRDVREGEQLRPAREQRGQLLLDDQALVVDADVGELRPGPLGQHVPRDEVRVVLHLRDDEQVAGADVGGAPRVGDEVDRLGRVAGEDGALGRRAGEGGDLDPRALVGLRGQGGDRVDAAVDARPVLPVVGVHRLDHRDRGLRGRAGVEVRDAGVRERREVGRRRREQAHAAAATSSRIQPYPRSSSAVTSSGPPSLTIRPSNMMWTNSGWTMWRMRW